MFKNKPNKKKIVANRVTATVDSKHTEKINFFQKEEQNLPKFKKK